MTYELTLVTPPEKTPVSVAAAIAFARLGDDEDNASLDTLIKSATSQVEAFLNRAVMRQSFQLTLDTFRDPTRYHDPHYLTHSDPGIRLPRPPVASVTIVQYRDSTGELVTLEANEYQLRGDLLLPAEGSNWPAAYGPRGVQITYATGVQDALDVPEAIRQGVLRVVLNLYERQPGNPLDEGTKALLAPHKVYS